MWPMSLSEGVRLQRFAGPLAGRPLNRTLAHSLRMERCLLLVDVVCQAGPWLWEGLLWTPQCAGKTPQFHTRASVLSLSTQDSHLASRPIDHSSPLSPSPRFLPLRKTSTLQIRKPRPREHIRLSPMGTLPQFSDARFLQTESALNPINFFFPSRSAVIK